MQKDLSSIKPWATEVELEYIEAIEKYGSERKAAKALGKGRTTLREAITRAKARATNPRNKHIKEACEVGGIQRVSDLSHGWKIVKGEDGNGYSLFFKNPLQDEELDFIDMVRNACQQNSKPPKIQQQAKPKGTRLVLLSLADIHFLKLCVKSETGYEYNRKEARRRVLQGVQNLLNEINLKQVGRFLFVLGNDILHVDNAKKTTTAGTGQDVDGSIFQGFADAKESMVDAINILSEHAPVDLIHCMSNHDWTMGWALSQCVGEHFLNNKNVTSTPYSLSESHRKYYKYGQNLLGLSHGDGAKEEKLYGLMVKEARAHISSSRNLYWILHHMHHKIRKSRGANGAFQIEKDHVGMTTVKIGTPHIQGEDIMIEYVRTPSPPDGWHDRKGYSNRQAAECYIFDPDQGMKTRHTEWF